jgi:hypothetical protein
MITLQVRVADIAGRRHGPSASPVTRADECAILAGQRSVHIGGGDQGGQDSMNPIHKVWRFTGLAFHKVWPNVTIVIALEKTPEPAVPDAPDSHDSQRTVSPYEIQDLPQ